MPGCENPLWPCSMCGAAACLAGFKGVTVVIHGSSGCYYYPATLLHAPLEGTFIVENEVIFGSEKRLHDVLDRLKARATRIALVMTCVPSVLGEDVRSMVSGYDLLLVDSPGFCGDVEAGYQQALSAVAPKTDPDSDGINIDGACLFDPFADGNIREITRLLGQAGISPGTIFCMDQFEKTAHASAWTIGTNGDFASGIGTFLGGTLGLDELAETFTRIGAEFPESDPAPVFVEIERENERITRACDKYLRRFDPPVILIFSGFAYGDFAARTLQHYLDADICFIGSRNEPGITRYPCGLVQGYSLVKDLIRKHNPDLILGSSFEQSVAPGTPFVRFTPPIRGVVKLAPRAIAGVGGTLSLIEDVLNACMDRR